MSYQSVVITRKGGPEVLQVAENPLREPGPNAVSYTHLTLPTICSV